MTDAPTENSADDSPYSELHLAWEVPEIAAVAALTAVAVLMLGGLVAGIVASTASYAGSTPSGIVPGTAITFGAQWAGPLIAIVLLGVIGVCWWQSESWAEAGEPVDERDRSMEMAGHIRRARQLSSWTQAALLLTCVGAIALLVGTVVQTRGAGGNPNTLNWSRYIFQGASLLAVIVIAGAGAGAGAGAWVARQINDGQAPSD